MEYRRMSRINRVPHIVNASKLTQMTAEEYLKEIGWWDNKTTVHHDDMFWCDQYQLAEMMDKYTNERVNEAIIAWSNKDID